MDLWIRSQDRKNLIKADLVTIGGYNDNAILVNGHVFGTYKSPEIAMKILDQIQKMMIINIDFHGDYQEGDLYIKHNILCYMHKIYEMPKTQEGGN